MKKRLTKKQKRSKEKSALSEYKAAHITSLYGNESVDEDTTVNSNDYFNDVRYFDNEGNIPENPLDFQIAAIPSRTMRGSEKSMYDFQVAVGERIFNSQKEAEVFLKNYVSKSAVIDKAKNNIDVPPDEAAQYIIYEAFDAKTKRKKVSLARKALNIYDNCSDAYNILAEETNSGEEAFEYYLKGIEAGEKFLADYEPKTNKDEYWLDIKLRPYLRSIEGLAGLYCANNNHKEAIVLYLKLLKLNKRDNQGVRFRLVYLLIAEGRFAEAQKLLNDFKDEVSLAFLFAHLLLEISHNGVTKKGTKQYEEIIKYNPYSLKYFAAMEKLPEEMPELFTPHSDEEAILTVFYSDPCFVEKKLLANFSLLAYRYFRDIVNAGNMIKLDKNELEGLNEVIETLEKESEEFK